MVGGLPPAEVDVRRLAETIGETAARAAADVDRQSRFPVEAVAALRGEGLIGAAVPRAYGGLGSDLQRGKKLWIKKKCSSENKT